MGALYLGGRGPQADKFLPRIPERRQKLALVRGRQLHKKEQDSLLRTCGPVGYNRKKNPPGRRFL